MAWSKVGETSVVIAQGAGTQDITLPGSPATDDLVIIATASDSACDNVITTSGYTNPQNDNDAIPGAHFGYKLMGATPDTIVTIDKSSSRIRRTLIQVWRGGDTASILGGAWDIASAASDSPNPPPITVSTNDLVIAVAFLDDDDTTISVWPTGYTNQLEGNTGQASASVGATVAISSKEATGDGTENPGAYTVVTSDNWKAGTISFSMGAGATPKSDSDTGTLASASALGEAYTNSDSAALTDGTAPLDQAYITSDSAAVAEAGAMGEAAGAGDLLTEIEHVFP
jgi:hypothetical protein